MSLGLRGLGAAAVAASGVLAGVAYAGAPPRASGPASPTDSNPWTTQSPDPAAPDGRAAMALQDGPDSRMIGIDNLSLAGSSPGGVPEPADWALMIVGLGGVGGLLRRKRAGRAFTGA